MRTVSGILKTLTGAVVKGESVIISLDPGFYTPAESYLRSLIRADTDDNGLLSVQLVPGGTYRVEVRGEVWGFTLPEGSGPLSWSEARALGKPLTPELEPTIAAYVDRQIASIPPGGVPQAFVHEQTTPASEWTANHGWGLKAGSIQLEIDSKLWIPDVIETSTSRVVIAFPIPTTGTLTLLKGA